jgi:hypothetical protein
MLPHPEGQFLLAAECVLQYDLHKVREWVNDFQSILFSWGDST